MGRVNTTVSSTPCYKKRPESGARAWVRWCAALACLLALCWYAPAAQAQQHGEVSDLQLERGADGLYLSAALRLELPTIVQDALYKGISMHFIADAEVLRPRWYWTDKVVAHATRYVRLSYQPLTRRWRLSTSSVPFTNSGLGVVLGQNFDDLRDALSSMQRISRWKIADGEAIDADVVHTVNFRFRLDLSQLPRPLQIGAVGSAGWSLMVTRNQRLVPEVAR